MNAPEGFPYELADPPERGWIERELEPVCWPGVTFVALAYVAVLLSILLG